MSDARDKSKPVFYGFLFVGFLSLLGGIFMFIYVVPQDMSSAQVPRDANFLFTEVFTNQLQQFQQSQRYAAALVQVGVSEEACARYSCRLTVPPDGRTYLFRLSKGGVTWVIDQRGPVPKVLDGEKP